MIVYVEQVLIDNLTINAILLVLVGRFLHLPIKKTRIVLATIVGTIFAFVFPLFAMDGLLLLVLKCALGLVIITIAFEYNTLKKGALIFFAFLLLTGLMGGVMMGLMFAIMGDVSMQNGTFVYTHFVPFGVYILLAFLVAKLFLDIYVIAQKKQQLKTLKLDVHIFFNEKVLPIKAFLDTGNLLTDPKSGEAIIVISLKVFCLLLGISTMDFLIGNYKVESWQVPLQTVGKKSAMLVFRASKVAVYSGASAKIFEKPILGLSVSAFHSSLGCDAILGSSFV